MATNMDFISAVMLAITTGYIVYFLVKIKISEKKEVALADEEFLMDKKSRERLNLRK